MGSRKNASSRRAARVAADSQPPVTQEREGARDTLFAFGPFRLLPRQKLLLRDGLRVKIYVRTWHVLLMLVERAGDLVRSDALRQRAFPDYTAKNATLRVHIALLRKILDDPQDETGYIENVNRTGYRFIKPVTRSCQDCAIASTAAPPVTAPAPQRMIGREDMLSRLITRVREHRLMTLVGAGGVGKSMLAKAALRCLERADFPSVRYIDVGPLQPAESVAPRVAGALGLSRIGADPLAQIGALIGAQRMLMVLDNCERSVDYAAHGVERLLGLAPGLHILVTSREPLRARGEYVLRLMPLTPPPTAAVLTVADALALPAVQLFIEHGIRTLGDFAVNAADVPAVVEICRKLDGLPLAIELAAASLDVVPIHQLALQPSHCLKPPTRGAMTTLPRHQTLRATFDWSHEILTSVEQIALRRLAVFGGCFEEESARTVLTDPDIASRDVLDLLTSLVGKSLLEARRSGARLYFRLLETTRVYALEKLRDSGECEMIERRHAASVARAT